MIILDGEGEGGEGENFAEFEAEVTAGGEGAEEGGEGKPAGEAEDGGEFDEGAEGKPAGEAGAEDGEQPKPKKSAQERIQELVARNRELERARERDAKGFEARLAALEGKKPLTEGGESGNEADERVAPDPKDLDKYPLGTLDDRYIQDMIDFRAEDAAKKIVDSLLQRQEQSEEQRQAEALLTDLRSKADNVVTKGSELHGDYESVVLEAGLRGDYDLTQITFEAAAESEHGAQILYDLATDPAEAKRVAQLSPIQQLKFVAERDAELSKSSGAAKIPGAGPPPEKAPRGGGGRKTISPATENFEDFERLANAGKK